MIWTEKKFPELTVGMVLSSMGGHRWEILGVQNTTLSLLDFEDGRESEYEVLPHRMEWIYMVETQQI